MRLRELAGEIADEATSHLHGCRFWDGGRCDCDRWTFVAMLNQKILALCRQERAKGLRAAASMARRAARKTHRAVEAGYHIEEMRFRETGEREISQWADRRARQVEKGE